MTEKKEPADFPALRLRTPLGNLGHGDVIGRGPAAKLRQTEAPGLNETTRKAAAIDVDYRHELCGLWEIYGISECIIGNIITR